MIHKVIVLLATVVCVWGTSVPALNEGFVEFFDTNISSVPYIASLQFDGKHYCSGVIFDKHAIITAASCLRGRKASNMTVRSASSSWNIGGQLIQVANFKIHERYSPASNDYDVGIIRLATALKFYPGIDPISLARKSAAVGGVAMVSGWGSLRDCASKSLRSSYVTIVSRKKCSSVKDHYGRAIKPSMICVDGMSRDACEYDAGAPLVTGHLLAGMVSLGDACATGKSPGLFVDIAKVREWIEETVEKFEEHLI
uniref:Lectizyme n=1 Tax=Glossina palpalis gambiensis TaxID=67801 RepID=A0A1B0BAE8_9MUSC